MLVKHEGGAGKGKDEGKENEEKSFGEDEESETRRGEKEMNK